MKSIIMRGLGFILAVVLLPTAILANAPIWQIVPQDSVLAFSATQNSAPVTGKFNHFTGEISFDPNQLDSSHVQVTVDINSITTSYQEVADTLKTADWFDVKLFPQAVFRADHFKKTGDNTYQADGQLTIRDKTLPLTLTFVLERYTPTEALVKGTALVKRTAFGLGKGDWAKTDEVKDEVQVSFTLKAVKK